MRLIVVGAWQVRPVQTDGALAAIWRTSSSAATSRIDDLPRYHQSAHVFCAPNTGNESQGIVLLEAMAAGLPVVASNIEGFAAVLTHGVEGLLALPGDEEALAAALLELLPMTAGAQAHGRSRPGARAGLSAGTAFRSRSSPTTNVFCTSASQTGAASPRASRLAMARSKPFALLPHSVPAGSPIRSYRVLARLGVSPNHLTLLGFAGNLARRRSRRARRVSRRWNARPAVQRARPAGRRAGAREPGRASSVRRRLRLDARPAVRGGGARGPRVLLRPARLSSRRSCSASRR